jgi:hypothetical protein
MTAQQLYGSRARQVGLRRGAARCLAGAACLAALVGLVACGEKGQTASSVTGKKGDQQPWEGIKGAALTPDFKPGDKTSWEAQLKARTERGQNEYQRTIAAKKP